jgi:transcription-repair coupling factor (superfamily II helicase)
MNTILGELGKSKKFIDLLKEIENAKGPVEISGLTDVGIVQVISAIHGFSKKSICLVTYNEIQAKKLYEDIKYFTDKVVYFPKKEIVTYDYIAESKNLPYERIEALNIIQSKKNLIVVTTVEAIMQKLPAKDTLYKNKLSFKIGESYSLENIKKILVNLGYNRCELIEGRGQFSVRGGILDISENDKTGIRIEFWGDEIDSIRSFNISSQRSISTLDKATIFPSHEYALEDTLEDVCNRIRNKYNKSKKDIVEEDIEQINTGDYISKVDKYFECFYEKQETILDYLSKDYSIFLDEIGKIKQRAKNISTDNKNLISTLIEKERMIPESIEDLLTEDDVENKIVKSNSIYLQKQDSELKINAEKFKFNYREVNFYKSEIDNVISDIKKSIQENKSVYVLIDSQEKAKKLKLLLEDQDIVCKIEEKLDQTIIVKSNQNIVTIGIGNLSTGFENHDSNQIVISANNLIEGKRRKRRVTHESFKDGEKVIFADLKVGDYVVHKKYGIGIYIGVNTIKADNMIKDYIKIKYRNEDVLYIPTNDLDSIRKYIGGDKIKPKINRLGGKEWENTKAKVKNNLREIAKELIELYAKREKIQGFAFSKDTPWQKEFEGNFPYQETDDQLRCIEEVKKDMEQLKPMDRLLCGDVGYGKTEVALRAAFKAVMDQKQVAYLAPTTVLADQQYQEFKERMKDFPIKVEIMNRFKSKKYQEEVVRKLKLGEVDIVIGTHRLLSKDVEFKDLGLLIIDEEHRFGVKDKEKIKQLKSNVDVLTMTATPIPRTLHMSIVGIRDMSVIYEPPHNRKPVQTYVLEYDEEVVREAITKELERGGQVFYLFNNVENIQKKADTISTLIPEANVAYAHGKMTGTKIEEIMQEFVNRETNVLVCTTILESGIDIPNANTVIVENADRMGLAQLYQIRGRVGRSERQAYAYITYKKDKLLTEVADKRLKAMKEFTEFGSGFKIAMRDLEIRGAGSLLGEIQSGHLEQVGYDTYCNLLDEVVKEMKGIQVQPEIEIQIDLNVTSYIPDEYISDANQKIEVYQNIALCRNEEDIQNVIDEIIDRFGNMPKELENLISIARIKYLSKERHIIKIASKNTSVVFTFENNDIKIDIAKLVEKYGNRIKFSAGIKPMVTLKMQKDSEKYILKEITEFIATGSGFIWQNN